MRKLRLLFAKTDRAVYISHLDLMHVLQRVFLRAGYQLKYSEGFNPHPVISIAVPLSVGHASVCELLDFTLLDEQLDMAEEVNEDRLKSWRLYYELLTPLKEAGKIELPYVPEECVHNAHMFYIKTKDIEERTALKTYLEEQDIMAVFHYIPLHSSQAGKKFGRFHGEDKYTTRESERLLRLPMYYGLKETDVQYVAKTIKNFYGAN